MLASRAAVLVAGFEPARAFAQRQRCQFELMYEPQVNGVTYERLLELSHWLLDDLRALGAKDFLDVQSFIWLTGDSGNLDSAGQWLRDNPAGNA